MLIYAQALLFLWAEAVATACYIQNHSIVRLRHGKTPYELLHGKLPDISFLHVIGALCYPTNENKSLGKLQPKVDIAPDVIAPIAEVVVPKPVVSTGSLFSTTVDQDAPSPIAHMDNDPFFGMPILEVASDQSSSTDSIHTIMHPDHQISEHNSKWTKDHPLENIISQLARPVSTRLQLQEQALFCYYDAFLTSELVPRQDKVMVITLKRIYKVKLDELGVDTPMVEKSKLDEDKEGKAIDPSHYHGMIGTLLYLTASRPDLQFAICMCARYQARPTEKHLHAVKRIFRYLRGTVNRGLWYPKESSIALTTFADTDYTGFQDTRRSTSEYQLADIFTKALGIERIKFLIYKLGMRSFTPETLKQLTEEVDEYWWYLFKYPVSYIEAMQEDLNEFERLEVWELVPRQDKVMVITLKRVYKVKLDELGVDTPMIEKSKLDEDKERKAVDPSHYHSMIGTLLYLTASRPDLQFAICMCARYQARPTEKHLHAVKRIFRYLRGTVNRGLWYPKESSIALTAFADTDYTGCQDTRRSTSEYQLADIFTKALGRERIKFLIYKLDMRSFTPETLKQLTKEVDE
nr:uncharacterized mitochondrial protein AtMg00810-like [Tanacetum cinerariifolium]